MKICQPWGSVMLAVAGLILGGCMRTAEGPQEEQKNPFYLTGKERLQAMDYQGAAESFERALQENPRSVLAHFELGLIYDTHLADYPAALYHYNKAIKLRPSGYPADTIRYRIPACRQELIKADSLAITNPTALRETEKLREENQELRRQIGELKAALATTTAPAPNRSAPSGPSAAPNPGGRNLTTSGGGGGGTSSNASSDSRNAPSGPASGSASTGTYRTHTVLPRETLASISRTYNVRLEALLAANRGLDPKHLKVGQTVKVPK